jgi:hypothetical protein
MISDFVRRFWAARLLTDTRETSPLHAFYPRNVDFFPEMWILIAR